MLARKLRDLARRGQYGHSRSPENYYMSEAYSDYYWNHGGVIRSHEEWVKVARLSKRYRRFVHYCKEVVPQWQTVATIYYMDNSVSEKQVDKDGNVRYIQVSAPSGDACL